MMGTPQPEFTPLDLIHWDVCFALKKLREQVAANTYKRLLINSDRPFLNIAAATTYFETVAIANTSRIRDLAKKTVAVIDLHNLEFEALENDMSNQNVGYALGTMDGGFLSISCEIECVYIRGKDVHYVVAADENYKDFAANNTFEIFSSQEFANRCAALHNVITAFYSEEELQRPVRIQPHLSNMQANHPIIETEEHFLTALYDKTKSNPEAGFSPNHIAQAIGLHLAELPAFQYQLQEYGYIRKIAGTKLVSLTGAGIRIAREAVRNYQVTVITVLNGQAIPMESKSLYRYIYFYRLSTQAPSEPYKSITVGISDFVQMYDWKLSFAAGGSAESILLLHGRDKIMRDIQDGTIVDEQTIEIMQNDLPHLPKYTPSDAPAMKGAEFYVHKRVRPVLPAAPTHRNIPDLIVEIRKAINLVFKKKHKEYLLEFTQEENLSDLFKDAQTKEEFNTRIISLGSTVGEMNVDLLRSLTGITDSNIRSIQLLRTLLSPLDPAVEPHIKTLQNIAAVRNGYPAHQDKPDTLKAYDALGLTFPVTDYSASWKTLQHHYLTALQGINEVIQQKYA
ncbi:hypothetical protein Q4E93_13105 [Flavitalea sp. BT771]|uniref:hypothetical protein n=1 Tax=Flavitalea sp. BT771 TaxID=3063329 RepID=UPI0026E16D21|nr:hypothetical protein [Flavitalea sp. BT771]MDO6431536.1 hypothetical protein [Flavitalea sp. BT771]MDV6220444.1 hypothetical protein [Flavitalea sp. BT771]